MSEPTEAESKAYAAGCAVTLLVWPISAAFQGLAWLCMWSWFVEPLGMPAIGYWHALGIAAVATLARPRSSVVEQRKIEALFTREERAWLWPRSLFYTTVGHLLLIGFGAFIRFVCMP